MKIDRFRHEFKQLNGLQLNDEWFLFRRPLQLWNCKSNAEIRVKKLNGLLDEKIEPDKTLAQWINELNKIEFSFDGGRGGSGGGGKTFRFGHAGGGGGGFTSNDFPARFNHAGGTTPEDTLQRFREKHAGDDYESGITVDEQGFVTGYVHGGPTSVAINGKKGEMVYHNHPSGGAFSDSDLISTSMSAQKGIVASGKKGDYILTKSNGFKGTAFVKAVKTAKMKGKSYDDAVNKWLTKNQSKYGYKYEFKRR